MDATLFMYLNIGFLSAFALYKVFVHILKSQFWKSVKNQPYILQIYSVFFGVFIIFSFQKDNFYGLEI